MSKSEDDTAVAGGPFDVSVATRLLTGAEGPRHAAKDQHLSEGTPIGDYKIVRPIASGGFGAVYEVNHATTGEPAALKLLHRDKAISPEIILRFHREAHVMQLIQHPSVVSILEFGVHDDGRPYFLMELLRGTSLGAYIREKRRIPLHEVIEILEPLCQALECAHSKDVIHRDIKSSNVFLADTEDGGRRVVLLDFGVAKIFTDNDLSLTTSRHAIGTPSSMAPEQIRGKPVDRRTDVYALGNLAFHMITGKLPFYDSSAQMVQHLHLHTPVPHPSSFVMVDRQIDSVIERAMEKEPANRFQNVKEFMDALRDAARVTTHDEVASSEQGEYLAFFAELFWDESVMEEPDEALLDEIESVLPDAERMLTERGFNSVMSSSNSLLMLHVLPDDHTAADRETALKAALEVSNSLVNRDTRDERIHINLCLHSSVGSSKDESTARVGNWAPTEPMTGVLATTAAVKALELTGQPVAGATDLHRIRG